MFKDPLLVHALQEVGRRLTPVDGSPRVRIYLIGGAAGLLRRWLGPSRSTADADVTMVEPADSWEPLRVVARAVGEDLVLPTDWLNDACRIHAWKLPLGWRDRCTCVLTSGSLEVWVPDRSDFIASKVLSAAGRPQDLEDLSALEPTPEEFTFVADHIERLEHEHLNGPSALADARELLEALRGGA